jgi:hypothetical protein
VPAFIGLCVAIAVGDYPARDEFYVATAQILPLLLVALLVERSYIFRSPQLKPLPQGPSRPPPRSDREWIVGALAVAGLSGVKAMRPTLWVIGITYQCLILFVLAVGEYNALVALARPEAPSDSVGKCSGALATGFAALVMLGLLGAIEARPRSTPARSRSGVSDAEPHD